MNSKDLRCLIIDSLAKQGFVIENGYIRPPQHQSKDEIRRLHSVAVQHKRDQARKALSRHETHLINRFAKGADLDPRKILPALIEVMPGSDDERLFRYASLQWSIPVSTGYGRRLRFLVVDRHNDKLIGIIGIGDPVYSLCDRDKWIGWSPDTKRTKLRNIMDAYVLGAVQPYSQLLFGKLVAMLVGSVEVREAFARKYDNRVSLISKATGTQHLALITTLSALGRSSIYNRITICGRRMFHPIGYSGGSGEFQFTNGTYKAIFDYATEHCEWSAKNPMWGSGSRNRREVIRKCLMHLGLREELLIHGIRRQIYAVPLGDNFRNFLCGQDSDLAEYETSVSDLFDFFRERWLLSRISDRRAFVDFQISSLALWPNEPESTVGV